MATMEMTIELVKSLEGEVHAIASEDELAHAEARLGEMPESDARRPDLARYCAIAREARDLLDPEAVTRIQVSIRRPTVLDKIEIQAACRDPVTWQFRPEWRPVKALARLIESWSLGEVSEDALLSEDRIALFDRCWEAVAPLLDPPTHALDFFGLRPAGSPPRKK
ncbi:MAG: hypothetical protein A2V88_17720 [Elusimicrobia bacterium RBG_16_66_12]|nr:MAG: hypothetical protein A2V88_17720 [Elusimicrobia bacterium RBG_16_66_12]